MSKIFHPLLTLIASASQNELAKYVEYLKHANNVRRARLPKQVHATYEERQTLLKYGKPKPRIPKGGQRKPKDLRELVLKIAEETGFGLTRIIGELRKLGIAKISRHAVRNVLRMSDAWADLLNWHGETLWACDFFSVKSVTSKGIRNLYVLVFLCLRIREVIVKESTVHLDSAWVCEQTEWFAEQNKDREKKPEMIIHDRDLKFTKDFTETVREVGLKTNPLPKGSPNLNGRCERVIETIELEFLAKFIVFGNRHMDYLISEFVTYYNTWRSHTERDYLPPIRDVLDDVVTLEMDQTEVKSYAGGLVKPFERTVA